MKEFYVTDNTGAIIRTGGCPSSMVNHQAQPGEHVFTGVADFKTQKHDFTTGTLVSRTRTDAEILDEIRMERFVLLNSCDWTQTQDSPLSSSKKAEWAAYRQALRDITLQADLLNVVWPTPPA